MNDWLGNISTMSHTKLLTTFTLFVALAACGRPDSSAEKTVPQAEDNAVGTATTVDRSAEEAALLIEGDYMRSIVVEIADDRYEGRGPGSPGDDMARRYLADEMAALGLLPGADDGG